MTTRQDWRHLTGAYNVRDLGGYDAAGKKTLPGVFLRADSTAGLTPQDCERLKGAGLALVVDLRSAREAQLEPSAFIQDGGVPVVGIPLLDHIQSAKAQTEFPESLGEMYCQLLDTGRGEFGQIFSLFARTQGLILFHCTAGKDRTGVVSMLLLELAGVSREQIILDYLLTEERLLPVLQGQLQKIRKMGLNPPEYLLHATREDIGTALDHLAHGYGSAREYLLGCGVTGEELSAILRRFVG